MNSKLKTTLVGVGCGLAYSAVMVAPRVAFSGVLIGVGIINLLALPISPFTDAAAGGLVGFSWKSKK